MQHDMASGRTLACRRWLRDRSRLAAGVAVLACIAIPGLQSITAAADTGAAPPTATPYATYTSSQGNAVAYVTFRSGGGFAASILATPAGAPVEEYSATATPAGDGTETVLVWQGAMLLGAQTVAASGTCDCTGLDEAANEMEKSACEDGGTLACGFAVGIGEAVKAQCAYACRDQGPVQCWSSNTWDGSPPTLESSPDEQAGCDDFIGNQPGSGTLIFVSCTLRLDVFQFIGTQAQLVAHSDPQTIYGDQPGCDWSHFSHVPDATTLPDGGYQARGYYDFEYFAADNPQRIMHTIGEGQEGSFVCIRNHAVNDFSC